MIRGRSQLMGLYCGRIDCPRYEMFNLSLIEVQTRQVPPAPRFGRRKELSGCKVDQAPSTASVRRVRGGGYDTVWRIAHRPKCEVMGAEHGQARATSSVVVIIVRGSTRRKHQSGSQRRGSNKRSKGMYRAIMVSGMEDRKKLQVSAIVLVGWPASEVAVKGVCSPYRG